MGLRALNKFLETSLKTSQDIMLSHFLVRSAPDGHPHLPHLCPQGSNGMHLTSASGFPNFPPRLTIPQVKTNDVLELASRTHVLPHGNLGTTSRWLTPTRGSKGKHICAPPQAPKLGYACRNTCFERVIAQHLFRTRRSLRPLPSPSHFINKTKGKTLARRQSQAHGPEAQPYSSFHATAGVAHKAIAVLGVPPCVSDLTPTWFFLRLLFSTIYVLGLNQPWPS